MNPLVRSAARRAALLLVALAPAVALAQGPPAHAGHGAGQGMAHGRAGDAGGDVHGTIHALMAAHTAVERRVADVPGGVETVTESDDPAVVALIRTHVRQMAARMEAGRPIRRWDPLFAELFARADAVAMRVEDTPRGVRVVETSADPQVTLLIRQHARRAVSEFVERGMDRMHEPTPLPEGYDAPTTH